MEEKATSYGNRSEVLNFFLICCDKWGVSAPVKMAKNLKLVLYSGGQSKSNHLLHSEVVRLALLERKRRQKLQRHNTLGRGPLRMTYIPFEADGSNRFFNRAMRRYRAAGIERFFLLEPDFPPTAAELAILLSSDVIYLAGGNTFTFLHHLRRSGLLSRLREFAMSGGVLAGLSAGAILMTPHIGLASVPKFDADENEVRLRDWSALDLVPFEFSPHDTSSGRRQKELLAYSKRLRHPLFAVADGGGLVVQGERLGLFGSARLYSRGNCWKLS